MHEAMLWKAFTHTEEGEAKHPPGTVQCRLCSHFCIIEPEHAGKCHVRKNVSGVLYTLVDDKVAAVNVDPVEKKPLYHFYPGTTTFSFGTMGCNLGCSFCQNYSLSQPPRLGQPISGRPATPEVLVQSALDANAHSISYTYSEPTIFFELMLETAKLAQQKGLKNIMVSNGFMSPDALNALAPYIDAANIDLKSFSDLFYREQCAARLQPVLRNLKKIHEMGWWLEVTTLLIPGLNDSYDELAQLALFLFEELGADTPWHLSRFHPDYRMRDRERTPVASLETARQIGFETGLRFVYIGNVPGHEGNSTLCPGCKNLAIDRKGFYTSGGKDKCPSCGESIPGRGMGAPDSD